MFESNIKRWSCSRFYSEKYIQYKTRGGRKKIRKKIIKKGIYKCQLENVQNKMSLFFRRFHVTNYILLPVESNSQNRRLPGRYRVAKYPGSKPVTNALRRSYVPIYVNTEGGSKYIWTYNVNNPVRSNKPTLNSSFPGTVQYCSGTGLINPKARLDGRQAYYNDLFVNEIYYLSHGRLQYLRARPIRRDLHAINRLNFRWIHSRFLCGHCTIFLCVQPGVLIDVCKKKKKSHYNINKLVIYCFLFSFLSFKITVSYWSVFCTRKYNNSTLIKTNKTAI